MTGIHNQQDDERLRGLFREAMPPVADDGFSDRVLRRIGRRKRIRQVVLYLAAGLGLAIAARPATELLMAAGDWMTASLGQSAVLAADRFEPMVVVVVLGLLSPFLVSLLED